MQNIITGVLMTDREGRKIDNAASQFVLSQIIKEATQTPQSFSSCIDLKFTNQPNLVTVLGLDSSLHSNYNHQIIYAKFNLKIIFTLSYERYIWHYNHATPESIRKAPEFSTGKELSAVKLLKKKFLF